MIGVFPFVPMPDTLTISLNELRALLNKAYEGVFGHSRDWSAMTETVMWLECHGYEGMDLFLRAIPNMEANKKARLSNASADTITVEANGTCLIEYAHLLSDVLIARAKKTERANARVHSVQYPQIIHSIRPNLRKVGFELSYYLEDNTLQISVAPNASQELENKDHYLKILDNGYTLKHETYLTLNQYADRVLVPASDQSRQGAGE